LGAVGLLCCKGTWLTRVYPGVQNDPQILFYSAASKAAAPASAARGYFFPDVRFCICFCWTLVVFVTAVSPAYSGPSESNSSVLTSLKLGVVCKLALHPVIPGCETLKSIDSTIDP